MKLLLANNASTTLASDIDASQTTITVVSVLRFPVIAGGSGDWFYATIADTTETAWEVVRVTATSGADWTVERGQDDTAGAAWSAAGSTISCRPNVQNIRDVQVTASDGVTLAAGNLTNDLTTGVPGGQTAVGGTGAGDDLVLKSTIHATKGQIIAQDEVLLQSDAIIADHVLGSPTYQTLGDFVNIMSPGLLTRTTISGNGDGTVSVGSFSGMIQIASDDMSINQFFDFAGNPSVACTDDDLNYIYLDYNSGTPIVASTTSFIAINGNTQFCIGLVYRRGTLCETLEGGVYLPNFRDSEWNRLEHRGIERMSGGLVAETGARYLTISSAVIYKNYSEITTTDKDTSALDRFTYVYKSATPGAWTFDDNAGAGWAQVSNILYDDGDGSPGNVGVAKYATYYVYGCLDNSVYVQMGQGAGNNLAQAQAEQPPTPPNYLAKFALLLAKVIVLRGVTNFTEVANTQSVSFTLSTPSDHNELTNLQGGSATERYHLTNAQHSSALFNNLGRSGGSTLIGGTGASENLTLISTSNATKGRVSILGNFSAGDLDLTGNKTYIQVVDSTKSIEFNNTGQITLGDGQVEGNGTSLLVNDDTQAIVLTATETTVLSSLMTLGSGIGIRPNANGTTAIQICKADGTTVILNVDTTNQCVGIGTASPNANAILDVTSTTKAFMPPRMTTAQRDAIASPAAGMVVYNTTTNVLNFHNGSVWGAV